MAYEIYECANCHGRFEVPDQKSYVEKHGSEISYNETLYVSCCPYCGSDEIEEQYDEEVYDGDPYDEEE